MQEVAIIGAGELGGELAHVLARRDIARHIRLIDPTGQVAAGKALDIMQAAPIEAFTTPVSGSADVGLASAASVVVLAEPASGEAWAPESALLLLREIQAARARAVVVCAGAAHRVIVERAVHDLRFPPERIIGSAPEALAAAVRALVALETNGSVKDVALAVLGIPPSAVVIPWADAAIDGVSADRALDEQARRRVAARVAALWPPGPCALAHAACEAVASVLGCSRRTVSCFVAPEGQGQARSRAIALPVRLGARGVERIERPALTVRAQVTLDNVL